MTDEADADPDTEGPEAHPEDHGLEPRVDGTLEPFDPERLPAAVLPSAAPTRPVRALAFLSIVIAGLCGGLIGFAFTDLQCDDGCATLAAFGGLVGALIGAGGVAVVAVLVLRAMDEWSSGAEPKRDKR